MREIFTAAVRVPDHAWLRPWRFLVIAGDRRVAFGKALEAFLVARDPQADAAARDKARNSPLRAPMIVVVVARLSEHPKVPHWEQRLSSGCSAQAILLAAEALGYAGIWRTGAPARDPEVEAELGIETNEEITGFVYLGTRERDGKPLPQIDLDQHVTHW